MNYHRGFDISVVGLDRQGQEGSFRIASFYFYRNTRWLQRAAKKRTFGPREETAAEDYDDFSHVNVANSRIPRDPHPPRLERREAGPFRAWFKRADAPPVHADRVGRIS